MRNLFLQFPSGVIDLTDEEYPDVRSATEMVCELLVMGEEWVQMRTHTDPDVYTQWSVAEWSDDGTPLQLICETFDGDIEVVSNDPSDYG